jgi:aminoglycoside 6'-N-acetyltransferase
VVLHGPRLDLRVATPDDVPALTAMLREPEVARWWDPVDEASVRELVETGKDDTTMAVEADGRVMGILLCYEEPEQHYRHASLDISLHPDFHDKGYGREALGLVIDHLIGERGHHRITIDPAAANARAIRAYEAVGFRPVGILREYERDPDSRTGWRDGLLMDLLASERGVGRDAP